MGIFRGTGALCLQSTLREVCVGWKERDRVVEKNQKGNKQIWHMFAQGAGEWHQEFFAQALQLFPKFQIMSKFEVKSNAPIYHTLQKHSYKILNNQLKENNLLPCSVLLIYTHY